MKLHIEIEVWVEADYSKGYPATLTDPAEDESFEITSVKLDDWQIMDNLSEAQIDELEEAYKEKSMECSDEY